MPLDDTGEPPRVSPSVCATCLTAHYGPPRDTRWPSETRVGEEVARPRACMPTTYSCVPATSIVNCP